MCVTFSFLRLFLVTFSTQSCRVSLDIVPGYAYKLQCRRTTYLGDYPAPAYHHTTTVRAVSWPHRERQCAMCVILPLICVFSWSQVELYDTGVRLLVARKHAHKARAPRITYLSDYPAHLNHSIATVRIVSWPAATYREHQCASHFSYFAPFLGHKRPRAAE